MYQRFFKRFFDIVLSACALLFLSPILLVTAIMVRLRLGRPVIFCQERPGKHEKIFKLYKFRSMTSETDANGNLLPDDARLTKFGKLLRSTSLDELPELWNILKGDMSIVGPRPLLVQYLRLYNQEQHRRHNVRPGLTGWAQVNGRNALNWEAKFDLDVWYVNNVSFSLDVGVVFRTILEVVSRDGISHEGAATMTEFRGTEGGAHA